MSSPFQVTLKELKELFAVDNVVSGASSEKLAEIGGLESLCTKLSTSTVAGINSKEELLEERKSL